MEVEEIDRLINMPNGDFYCPVHFWNPCNCREEYKNMTNADGFGGEFDYFDEYPTEDMFIYSMDQEYRDEITTNLVEQIKEYLTFSSMSDLIKLIGSI